MHGTDSVRALPPDSAIASLTDGVIIIRPFRPHEAESLFKAISESLPQLSTWLTWCRPDHGFDDCAGYILKSLADWKKGDQFHFGTFDAANEQLLGSVAVNQINRAHNLANLGYWVRTSKAGMGIATASVRLVARFCFESLGLTRLEIVVPLGNKPSQRTALKAGAVLEGSLRQRLLLSGKLHDAHIYSLLPSDLRTAPDSGRVPG